MKKDIGVLLKNGNFLLVSFTFMWLFAIYSAIGGVLPYLTIPFGYSNAYGGIFGGFFIVSGIIGSTIFASQLDKTAKYKKTFIIVCVGSLIMASLAIPVFFSGDRSVDPKVPPSLPLCCVMVALMGFFILPVLPVGFSFVTEVTYPVSEVMSVGTMMLAGQIMAVIVTTTATMVGGATYRPYVPVFFALLLTVPALSSLFCKEDLRKLNASTTDLKKPII